MALQSVSIIITFGFRELRAIDGFFRGANLNKGRELLDRSEAGEACSRLRGRDVARRIVSHGEVRTTDANERAGKIRENRGMSLKFAFS